MQALKFLKNHANGKTAVHKVESFRGKIGLGDPKACKTYRT